MHERSHWWVPRAPGDGKRRLALRRVVVGDSDVGDLTACPARPLDVATGGDRNRAGSAVQRRARVIAEHRATERAVTAGADHEQIRILILGLLVKTATGGSGHDAD